MKPTLFFIVIVLFLVSYLFGFEPQIHFIPEGEIERISWKEYLEGSIAQNGDNAFTKVLTAVSYPGALLGRAVHNKIFVK